MNAEQKTEPGDRHVDNIHVNNDFSETPNIIIAGPSGSGKSTSLRNLPPDRTIILSTEMRMLPFRGHRKFTMNMPVNNWRQFIRLYNKALASLKADIVVIESFTSMVEFAYNDIIRSVLADGGNTLEAWMHYRDAIKDVLITSKSSNKLVIFTAIDRETQGENGNMIKAVDVQGSLFNNVEKEFTIALWTKIIDSDLSQGTPRRYVFCTNSDGLNKAKTPMGMFPELYIDNDIAAAIDSMADYYNGDDETASSQDQTKQTGDMPE